MLNLTNCNFLLNQSMTGSQVSSEISGLVSFYGLICFAGITANLLIITPLKLQVKQNKLLGIYLFALCLFDLAYALSITVWLGYIYSSTEEWTFNSVVCHISGFLFYSNIYISSFLLGCISVDRYSVALHSVEPQVICKRKYFLAVLTSVLAVGCSSRFFISSKTSKNDGLPCYENYELTDGAAIYNYCRFAVGFFLPLVILTLSFMKVFLGTEEIKNLNKAMKAKARHLSTTTLALFFICFGPYHIILLLRTLNFSVEAWQSCDFDRTVYKYFIVSLLLSSISCVVDPFLYILISDNIRQDLTNSLQGSICAAFGRRTRV